ncbi:restriction endonuclease subunit S [Peptoanaerobacter stomatis]|uniref:restriction endonuclease subunit S n=1 Tax=Peptoanaerobacter stomatis TaxID=796937 RepID=UPI003FA025C9
MKMILLEDCCDILDSMRIPITASDREEGQYPYYGANGLQGYINDYIFDDDLVLLAEDGGNFGSKEKPIAYRVSGRCWVNNHAHVLKAKSGLNIDYLCYSLMFYNVDGLINGATRQKLTQTAMRKMKIPYRVIDEQVSIVGKLKIITKIIEKRKQELHLLDNLIKARFIELFGNVEKKIPLSSLCDVSGGYSFKSGDITSDGAVKILQIGNVYLDDVNWETTNYLPDGYDETYSRFLLNEGDIVVALTRPIIQSLGNVKACIVKESDMPCLLNQRVGRIVPKKTIEVSLKFIYVCLMTDGFTRYVESCCIGCSQPNISTKDIENYMVPDVSFKEQMQFVNFKEQVDKSKVAVQKALDETQLLFDSLMQKYFG